MGWVKARLNLKENLGAFSREMNSACIIKLPEHFCHQYFLGPTWKQEVIGAPARGSSTVPNPMPTQPCSRDAKLSFTPQLLSLEASVPQGRSSPSGMTFCMSAMGDPGTPLMLKCQKLSFFPSASGEEMKCKDSQPLRRRW